MVYECNQTGCNGWADRLRGIISIYAVSLFTNRQFILNMTFPCDLETILHPNEVNWLPSQLSSERLSKMTIEHKNWDGGRNAKEYYTSYEKEIWHNMSTLPLEELFPSNADVVIYQSKSTWVESFRGNFLHLRIMIIGLL